MIITGVDWQATGTVVQAVATLVLVGVTWKYASTVKQQTEEARKTADASQRSLDHLTAEKRKWAVDALHQLRNGMRGMRQTATEKLDQETFGNIQANDLYQGEHLQRRRGLAVGVGGQAGQKAIDALFSADKVNKRRQDYADGYAEDDEAAYRDALEGARDRFEEAEEQANERLEEFRDGGPYQPVPTLDA